MSNVKVPRLPRDLQQRIVRRAAARSARGERAIVLTLDKKTGAPSRVYGLDEYLRKSQIARKVKPWTHRKKTEALPDPLGAKSGRILGSLSRTEIYD